ncbi:hypothetical protein [Bradymonas sediminis]|uniref:Uncharacterized protein n=1 Tax=Bradymonas sediminis TaxID=1548548 RepID=A0A2Z4FIJ3_9DELT|nr:hypothetical protein [Bradymonas sediminis]AWV88690.1 hypothetical protein DN745_04795 [Bradymonas sediminis]TDP63622.1 hypothetical protein DFR33_11079 [Bradymonas sediminis]
MSARAQRAPGGAPQPHIQGSPWDPDTPWTKALKAVQNADVRVRINYQLRAENSDRPSFFFDASDVFFGADRPTMGMQVLSNITEI